MSARAINRKLLFFGLLLLALAWLVVTGAPFLFMFLSSVKSQMDLYTLALWELPEVISFANYAAVLQGNFFVYFSNSAFVVGLSVGLLVIIPAMASYIFARMKYSWIRRLFGMILAGMAIPIHVTLIPVYIMTRNLGLYDTQLALIGPYVAFELPLTVFILTEFMRDIPVELEEAATIDGCSSKRVFFQIIFPLSKPGIFTILIYNAVFLWNEFVFALVLTSSVTKRTLPLGIWEFQGKYTSNVPMMMAVLTLSTLPMILVYLFGQEKLVKGMMAGAIKG